MAETKKAAAARKRSEASKKSAATRKAKQAAAALGQEIEKTEESTLEPYKPRHTPLRAASVDHALVEDQRQEQLDEERDEHNERTGDGGW